MINILNNFFWLDELMKTCNKCIKCKQHKKGVCEDWSPLLLIVPLRLGLNEFNSEYKEPIKVFLVSILIRIARKYLAILS